MLSLKGIVSLNLFKAFTMNYIINNQLFFNNLVNKNVGFFKGCAPVFPFGIRKFATNRIFLRKKTKSIYKFINFLSKMQSIVRVSLQRYITYYFVNTLLSFRFEYCFHVFSFFFSSLKKVFESIPFPSFSISTQSCS